MTAHTVTDTAVLLRRSLRHIVRSPDTIITTAVTPIALVAAAYVLFAGHNQPGGGFAAGLMLGAVIVLRDLSERKRAETELRRAHDRLQQRAAERTAGLSRAVGQLEAALLTGDRAGKCSLFMAEHLRFQERFGHCWLNGHSERDAH